MALTVPYDWGVIDKYNNLCMRSPGKQVTCMISVHIISDIYWLSPVRGSIPRYCLFRVWIELLPDTLVFRMEKFLANIRDPVIKDNPTCDLF